MQTPPLESLRKELLCAGVSPRYVRRYFAELSDHYEAAVEESHAAGMTTEEATAAARRQLGDCEMLFQSVVQHAGAFAFARRHPVLTFLFLPIPALLLTKALIVCVGLLSGFVLSQLSIDFIGGTNELRKVAHALTSFGAPVIVVLLYCVLAQIRACGRAWSLLSAVLISFVAGCLQLEINKPLLDLGFAEAGVAQVTLAVTPIVLVPLAIWMAFTVFRRRIQAIPIA